MAAQIPGTQCSACANLNGKPSRTLAPTNLSPFGITSDVAKVMAAVSPPNVGFYRCVGQGCTSHALKLCTYADPAATWVVFET